MFDHEPSEAKTGIANRALRPTLGLVDPDNILTMPNRVTAYRLVDPDNILTMPNRVTAYRLASSRFWNCTKCSSCNARD